MIDELIAKTKHIEHLTFSGGEPTLNIPAMVYFLHKLKENNIKLEMLSIITNGIVKDDGFNLLLKDYYNYISGCLNYDKLAIKTAVNLVVSKDHFHKTDSEAHYNYYVNSVGGFANVKKSRNGHIISNNGRARTQINYYYGNERRASKIAYFTKENNNFPCKYMRWFRDIEPDIIALPCKLHFNIYGDVTFYAYDYDNKEQEIAFNIFADSEKIIEGIEKFNYNKCYCKVKDAAEALKSECFLDSNIKILNNSIINSKLDNNLEFEIDIYIYALSKQGKTIKEIKDKIKSELGIELTSDYIRELRPLTNRIYKDNNTNIEMLRHDITEDKLILEQLKLTEPKEVIYQFCYDLQSLKNGHLTFIEKFKLNEYYKCFKQYQDGVIAQEQEINEADNNYLSVFSSVEPANPQ